MAKTVVDCELVLAYKNLHRVMSRKDGTACAFASLSGRRVNADGTQEWHNVTMSPALWDCIAGVATAADTVTVKGTLTVPERGEAGFYQMKNGRLQGTMDEPTPVGHVKSVFGGTLLPKFDALPVRGPAAKDVATIGD